MDVCFKLPFVDHFAKTFMHTFRLHKKRLLRQVKGRGRGSMNVVWKSLAFRNIIHYKPVAHNGMRRPKPRRV